MLQARYELDHWLQPSMRDKPEVQCMGLLDFTENMFKILMQTHRLLESHQGHISICIAV